MLSLHSAACSFAPAGVAARATPRASVSMETAADLEALATKLNPVVGFWDPMNLVEYDQVCQVVVELRCPLSCPIPS